MRILIVMGAALSLAACGGNDRAAEEANMAATDNMMMDANMSADPMMNGTGTMAMDPMMNGANAMDPATQNAMQQDMNTNDPDTNLANGM